MSRIRGKSTRPEMLVRRYLHAAGFRFRLHQRRLPGSPDLVLRKHNAVIFIHGCFWHQHVGCRVAHLPKTRPAYWKAKLDRNVERDARDKALLGELGWRILTVWECALATIVKREKNLPRIAGWVSSAESDGEIV